MKIEQITDKITLVCGDCMEYMRTLEDKTFDLTITSPPYDSLRTYGNVSSWNFDVFSNIANELYRVTADGGVVVWIVGDAHVDGSETGTSFRQALYFKEIGFNLHDTMFYVKKGGLYHGSCLCYPNKVEYMFILSKGKPKSVHIIRDKENKKPKTEVMRIRRPDGTQYMKRTVVRPFSARHNYWIYPTGFNQSTKYRDAFKHPAIFPEQLAYDHIISWSNENDLVFDPFMGSGTSAIIALKADRKFVGCEINGDYYDIAANRVNKTIANQQPKLDLI